MDLVNIVTIIGEVVALVGTVTPVVVLLGKVINGEKCQLRKDMLDIYYKNLETRVIRQYEYENFVHLYEAYKALKGNSFIDKIYAEVKTWKVIT